MHSSVSNITLHMVIFHRSLYIYPVYCIIGNNCLNDMCLCENNGNSLNMGGSPFYFMLSCWIGDISSTMQTTFLTNIVLLNSVAFLKLRADNHLGATPLGVLVAFHEQRADNHFLLCCLIGYRVIGRTRGLVCFIDDTQTHKPWPGNNGKKIK